MAVIVGVARETAAGERRVALSPETCKKLVAAGPRPLLLGAVSTLFISGFSLVLVVLAR